LGTTDDSVVEAIKKADAGQGVVVLADLGSSILTVRHILENNNSNGHIRLVDAPLVEGAIAAAVMSSAGQDLEDVARAAEEARSASKF
jgi:dihydroxyacetone kinase DhaKLM complex PTS-EIIA-like component DhaM